MEFTHLDKNGAAHMVDVGAKDVTARMARAQAEIGMQPQTLRQIQEGTVKKGDVLSCARIAGIMAAKRTFEWIPMCHPIPIESVSVDFEVVNATHIRVLATLRCTWKTGIEMEALTAASAAALTIYDMCKSADRAMEIGAVRLLEKDGGKSGHFVCGNTSGGEQQG